MRRLEFTTRITLFTKMRIRLMALDGAVSGLARIQTPWLPTRDGHTVERCLSRIRLTGITRRENGSYPLNLFELEPIQFPPAPATRSRVVNEIQIVLTTRRTSRRTHRFPSLLPPIGRNRDRRYPSPANAIEVKLQFSAASADA